MATDGARHRRQGAQGSLHRPGYFHLDGEARCECLCHRHQAGQRGKQSRETFQHRGQVEVRQVRVVGGHGGVPL